MSYPYRQDLAEVRQDRENEYAAERDRLRMQESRFGVAPSHLDCIDCREPCGGEVDVAEAGILQGVNESPGDLVCRRCAFLRLLTRVEMEIYSARESAEHFKDVETAIREAEVARATLGRIPEVLGTKSTAGGRL